MTLQANETLGQSLRRLRVLRGLTQREACLRSGLSDATLVAWEGDQRRPGAAPLEALLAALRVSARERSRLLAAATPLYAIEALRDAPWGPPVHAGGIVRAMRLRCGSTQTELARALRIGQAKVAKWESGDLRIDEDDWDAILAALRARPEERAVFAAVDRTTPPPGDFDPSDFQSRLEAITESPAGAEDILLLGLQAEIWSRSVRDRMWDGLLCRVVAHRAHRAVVKGRLGEAQSLAEGALRMADRFNRRPDATHGFYTRIWIGRRLEESPRDHADRIEAWIVDLPDAKERAWMMVCLSFALAQDGQRAAAIAAVEQGSEIAERHGALTPWSRATDLAEVYLALDDPKAALETLERCDATADRLERARALKALGEPIPEPLLAGLRVAAESGTWIDRHRLSAIEGRSPQGSSRIQ